MDRSVARKGALQPDSSTNVLSPSTSTRHASNSVLEAGASERLAALEPAVLVEAQSRINDTTADAADSMPAAVGDGLASNPFSPSFFAEVPQRAESHLQGSLPQETHSQESYPQASRRQEIVPQDIVAQPAYANPLNTDTVKNSSRDNSQNTGLSDDHLQVRLPEFGLTQDLSVSSLETVPADLQPAFSRFVEYLEGNVASMNIRRQLSTALLGMDDAQRARLAEACVEHIVGVDLTPSDYGAIIQEMVAQDCMLLQIPIDHSLSKAAVIVITNKLIKYLGPLPLKHQAADYVYTIGTKRADKIVKLLHRVPVSDRAEIKDAFEQLTGRPLESVLRNRMPTPSYWLANACLRNPTGECDAADMLRLALGRMPWTSAESGGILRMLSRRSIAQIEHLFQRFQQQYFPDKPDMDVKKMVLSRMGRTERRQAELLLSPDARDEEHALKPEFYQAFLMREDMLGGSKTQVLRHLEFLLPEGRNAVLSAYSTLFKASFFDDFGKKYGETNVIGAWARRPLRATRTELAYWRERLDALSAKTSDTMAPAVGDLLFDEIRPVPMCAADTLTYRKAVLTQLAYSAKPLQRDDLFIIFRHSTRGLPDADLDKLESRLKKTKFSEKDLFSYWRYTLNSDEVYSSYRSENIGDIQNFEIEAGLAGSGFENQPVSDLISHSGASVAETPAAGEYAAEVKPYGPLALLGQQGLASREANLGQPSERTSTLTSGPRGIKPAESLACAMHHSARWHPLFFALPKALSMRQYDFSPFLMLIDYDEWNPDQNLREDIRTAYKAMYGSVTSLDEKLAELFSKKDRKKHPQLPLAVMEGPLSEEAQLYYAHRHRIPKDRALRIVLANSTSPDHEALKRRYADFKTSRLKPEIALPRWGRAKNTKFSDAHRMKALGRDLTFLGPATLQYAKGFSAATFEDKVAHLARFSKQARGAGPVRWLLDTVGSHRVFAQALELHTETLRGEIERLRSQLADLQRDVQNMEAGSGLAQAGLNGGLNGGLTDGAASDLLADVAANQNATHLDTTHLDVADQYQAKREAIQQTEKLIDAFEQFYGFFYREAEDVLYSRSYDRELWSQRLGTAAAIIFAAGSAATLPAGFGLTAVAVAASVPEAVAFFATLALPMLSCSATRLAVRAAIKGGDYDYRPGSVALDATKGFVAMTNPQLFPMLFAGQLLQQTLTHGAREKKLTAQFIAFLGKHFARFATPADRDALMALAMPQVMESQKVEDTRNVSGQPFHAIDHLPLPVTPAAHSQTGAGHSSAQLI